MALLCKTKSWEEEEERGPDVREFFQETRVTDKYLLSEGGSTQNRLWVGVGGVGGAQRQGWMLENLLIPAAEGAQPCIYSCLGTLWRWGRGGRHWQESHQAVPVLLPS